MKIIEVQIGTNTRLLIIAKDLATAIKALEDKNYPTTNMYVSIPTHTYVDGIDKDLKDKTIIIELS